MKTITYNNLEWDPSIVDGNIVLWCISDGIERELVFPGAGTELQRKADWAATYTVNDPDEPGSTAYRTDNDEFNRYIEDHISDFIMTWKGEVIETTEHLN
jgi:hypothetical protein